MSNLKYYSIIFMCGISTPVVCYLPKVEKPVQFWYPAQFCYNKHMLSGQLATAITSDALELKGFWMNQKSDIAVFHSHGTSGDFYTHEFIEKEGEMLAKKSISFLTANNRGHDVYADIRKHNKGKVEWASGGGGFEKFEDCLIDIKAWIDFLQKQGVKKVIIQAHSLTQKILYFQWMKKDKRIIGQIHLSPCNDAGMVKLRVGEKKYNEINTMVNRLIEEGKGNELLPKECFVVCPMSALAYYGYLTEEGPGNLFPYHDPKSKKWKALGSIKEPILAVFGEDDIYINGSCKENNSKFVSSLFREKAKSSKTVKTIVIPHSNHSYIGTETILIQHISSWISKILNI